MTEQLLRHPMVEIGDGHPLPSGIPPASGTKCMDMGMTPTTENGSQCVPPTKP